MDSFIGYLDKMHVIGGKFMSLEPHEDTLSILIEYKHSFDPARIKCKCTLNLKVNTFARAFCNFSGINGLMK